MSRRNTSPPAKVENRPPPGVRRLAFYCDESGIGGNLRHYGFGSLIMHYQRRGDFADAFREISGHRTEEVKWNKAKRGKLANYKRLIDFFFETSWLYFHCKVVKRDWVDARRYHNGSYEQARVKHFTQFLANKVKHITKLYPEREHEFRVYVDPIPSSYRKAAEAVHVISNHMVNQAVPESPLLDGARRSPIRNVLEVDSKERPEIQLCDLLLGAVVDSWNEQSSNEAKQELKAHIAQYLGWENLRHGTYAGERKFNVWWLTDTFKSEAERPVLAKAVQLKHELPPPRRYRAPSKGRR